MARCCMWTCCASRWTCACASRVPVHTFGEPQGVKMQGGVFEMVTREVEIECLPGDIPEEFKVDVSDMLIGKQLRAADLPFDPEKMKLLTDPQRVIAHVVMLKKEEEPAAEAAVAAEAAPAEPEVIKKGKKEEEGEAEGARGSSEGREEGQGEVTRPDLAPDRTATSHRMRFEYGRMSAVYETDRRARQSRPRIRMDAA